MTELLVVRSKIKDVAKDMNVSGNFADALSVKTEQLVKDAIRRAQENKRRTIMAHDL